MYLFYLKSKHNVVISKIAEVWYLRYLAIGCHLSL